MTYVVEVATDPEELGVAYGVASLHCHPDHPAAPPANFIEWGLREGLLYVAREGGRIVGTMLMSNHHEGVVEWLTILKDDPVGILDALCDYVATERGLTLSGTVRNDQLRTALLQHDRVEQTGDDPHHLTWRAHGNH